ncbi:hypothetical protein [Nocardia tenerifensis]|nr:hypothetical protein [Nocardia tenerifensis]
MNFDWILNGQRSGDPLATALYGPLFMVLNMLEVFQGGIRF